MKHFVKNRTFWHSGLLFILTLCVSAVNSKIGIGFPENGAVNVRTNGDQVFVGADPLEAVCQLSEKSGKGNKVIKWLLNDKQLSTSDSVQVSSDSLSEAENKLECFVSNVDLFHTSSYALVYLVKVSQVGQNISGSLSLNVNEGQLVMKEGARVSLQCKVEIGNSLTESDVSFPGIWWLKNAKILNLATSQNFDVKVISELEQHLVLDNVSVSDAGTYGCLVMTCKN